MTCSLDSIPAGACPVARGADDAAIEWVDMGNVGDLAAAPLQDFNTGFIETGE